MLHTASGAGSAGVGLWVHDKEQVPSDQVVVLLEAPRLLLVTLPLRVLQVDCLVQHAPSDDAAWWEATQGRVAGSSSGLRHT